MEAARERGAGRQASGRELDAVDDEPVGRGDARCRNRRQAARRLDRAGGVPVGRRRRGSVPAWVTAAVCADVAEVEPLGLVAVTTTRMVFARSVLATVYVDAVAPEIAAQLLPCASQLCHAYVNVGVVSLVQVPCAGGERLTDLRGAADRRRGGVRRRVVGLCGRACGETAAGEQRESRDERGDDPGGTKCPRKVVCVPSSLLWFSDLRYVQGLPRPAGRSETPINQTLTCALDAASRVTPWPAFATSSATSSRMSRSPATSSRSSPTRAGSPRSSCSRSRGR